MSIRSYCNPVPNCPASTQEAMLSGELYVENKRGTAWGALLRSLRPKDVVEVAEIFVLGPGTVSTAKKRRIITERAGQIEARGAVLREVATGRRSDHGHLPDMLMRAYERIARGGQGAAGKRKQGRPKKLRAKEELQIMEFEWVSKRNKTIADVLVAVRNRGIKRATVSEFYRHFGSRIAGKSGE